MPGSDAELVFETPERVSLSLDVAGLGTRVLAYLVDLFIVFLFWVTVLLVYSLFGDALKEVQALSGGMQLLLGLATILTSWGYDVLFETLWRGQSPGKRVVGLRVVKADGSPVGFVEAAIRNLARLADVFPALYTTGALCVALTPRHQRLGDLLAGTLVVKERAYDLSRYSGLATAAAPSAPVAAAAARVARGLEHQELERVLDFLARREDIDAEARVRIARKIAAVFAARAGAPPPADAEAESFLEALARAQGGAA